MQRGATWWALAAALAACGDGSVGVNPDAAVAGDAATAADGPSRPDGILPLLWADFTATGCRVMLGDDDDEDAGTPVVCVGDAPLTLQFAASAAAPLTDYVWTFGDGAQSTEASPEHIYSLPGSYDVSLVVGGSGGTARADRPGYVVVEPAGVGGACGFDDQCAAGLTCICDDGSACPAGLENGLCSRLCPDGSDCPDGSTCADLAPSGWPGTAEWAQALCLRDCTGDGDCGGDLRCRELPRVDGDGWVRGCFAPDVLRDVGASCLGGDGMPDDWLCTGGECLAIGLRGQCSATCDGASDCPSNAACATFNDAALGSHCLLRCAVGECVGDPWLSCESPDRPGPPSGALGFSIAGPDDPAGYCAPNRCGSPLECGPGGDCVGGFCGAKGAE